MFIPYNFVIWVVPALWECIRRTYGNCKTCSVQFDCLSFKFYVDLICTVPLLQWSYHILYWITHSFVCFATQIEGFKKSRWRTSVSRFLLLLLSGIVWYCRPWMLGQVYQHWHAILKCFCTFMNKIWYLI